MTPELEREVLLALRATPRNMESMLSEVPETLTHLLKLNIEANKLTLSRCEREDY